MLARMSTTSPGRLIPHSGNRYFPDRFTEIVQGTVVNVNMVSWTVDVMCKLDSTFWANVQQGAPYLHPSAGEGFYVCPEVGATCMFCLPSDKSLPFILAYVSPGTTTVNGSEKDAVPSKLDQVNSPAIPPVTAGVDYTYSSGRPVAKPGDMIWRGRDGNQIIMHRGGVLQIGSTELAQRIYIPLTNMITDISEHYEHYNVGGTIKWGVQPLDYEDRETQWKQTFRIFADDKYCDIRVTCGNALDHVRLPDGDKDIEDPAPGTAKDAPIVYEVAIIPSGDKSGFAGVNGDVVEKSYNQLKFLFKLDRKGQAYCRFEGDVMMSFRKNLFIRTLGDLKIEAKSLSIQCTGNAQLGTANGATELMGKSVKIAGGGVGVARLMDLVFTPAEQIYQMILSMGLTSPVGPVLPTIPPIAGTGVYGAINTASDSTECS